MIIAKECLVNCHLYNYCSNNPVRYVDPDGRDAEDVVYFVLRNFKSYEISTDRTQPKNTYLDIGFLWNKKTGEMIAFAPMQTVANYPSTNSKNEPVNSCYKDTIAPGHFELKVYTTTDVASGQAGIIINAKTLDGRIVNNEGYTENPLSTGRGLQHSNGNPEGTGDYNNPYSKQCFIMPSANNKIFFDTLEKWNVQDGDVIEGVLHEFFEENGKIIMIKRGNR